MSKQDGVKGHSRRALPMPDPKLKELFFDRVDEAVEKTLGGYLGDDLAYFIVVAPCNAVITQVLAGGSIAPANVPRLLRRVIAKMERGEIEGPAENG